MATSGLTAGDYTVYVWAQQDNTINSHEGSTPQYFTLTVEAASPGPTPTPTPTPEPTPDPGPGSPQTGDSSNIPLWALCGGAAVVGLALCGMGIKKRLGRKAG